MLNRSIFALLITIIAAFSVQAQSISIGARAGVGLFTISNDGIEDQKYTTGFSAAIPVEIRVSPTFSIQPELQFVQKGVAFEEIVLGEDVRSSTMTDYLSIPILLKGGVDVRSARFSFFAGPNFGYALNRKDIVKVGDNDRQTDAVDFIDDGDIQDNRFDIGVDFGLGADYRLRYGSIVLDARYSLDLNDNAKFDNDAPSNWDKSFNNGFNFTIGYMVPIGK